MHRHADYLHRAPEMASLPAVPIAATPSCLSRCKNGQNKKEKKNKKNKSSSSTSDEKQNRIRSRSAATAVEDQPEMNQQQPKRPSTHQQFISFGMAPTTNINKEPQQLLTTTQSQQSDGGESMVSGYIYTGMDRDIAEEFILHSMTIPSATQASSVKSGFSVANKRDVC